MLVETDTSGSGCRVSNTAMEYSNGQVELYIKDNSNKIISKVMHITGGQTPMSFMDSTVMIRNTEREFSKKVVRYTE